MQIGIGTRRERKYSLIATCSGRIIVHPSPSKFQSTGERDLSAARRRTDSAVNTQSTRTGRVPLKAHLSRRRRLHLCLENRLTNYFSSRTSFRWPGHGTASPLFSLSLWILLILSQSH